jgi:hypothetical protein
MALPDKRKIIQLTGTDGIVVALCNDGTVWQSKHHEDGELYGWRKAADIPQPKGGD